MDMAAKTRRRMCASIVSTCTWCDDRWSRELGGGKWLASSYSGRGETACCLCYVDCVRMRDDPVVVQC